MNTEIMARKNIEKFYTEFDLDINSVFYAKKFSFKV